MKKRRYGREIALKILYQHDTSGRPLEEIEENTFSGEKVTEGIKSFARELVIGTVKHQDEFDVLLDRFSPQWKTHRMSIIDRNILRIALFELTYTPETPIKVILNEAIEIAKKYGDLKSHQFINGVLDTAGKELRKESNSSGIAI